MSTDPALSAPGPALPATPSSIATSQINPAPASTAALPTSAAQTSSSVPYNVPPANAPAPAPAQPAAPVPPAANPVIAVIASTTTTPAVPPAPGLTGDDYISVRWVETWIGGTSRTWVPETTTIHFESRTPGPLPGSGRIGLGTIKGEVGRTKTIYAGAAATQAAGWMRGVAAAVGVGVVGLVA
ncbi:hypothetical protein T440DRAFT_470485 [Plenodomus tracheiphilus IPT5]|uniref:Uncharacterized protein n=1 Tax=Plenodomus tracheiphilus IPT5 TaxID=1408161 RepID=A0A6A7B0J3_9PLEO|nr:hypothetical protein T440DRAFT_470485 [Plenodomus tracheiphilus IPT5]